MYKRRPDLVVYVNGLPLVLIELKAVHSNLINAYSQNITDREELDKQIYKQFQDVGAITEKKVRADKKF